MIKKINSQKGFTMISLVITIIAMSIIAAVVFNTLFSDDGVITESTISAYAQRFAAYQDEMMVSLLSGTLQTDEGLAYADSVILLDDQVKLMIPSITDDDIGKFMIINGYLYYIGDDDMELSACEEIGIVSKDKEMSTTEFKTYAETLAISKAIDKMQGERFVEIVDNLEGTEDDETVTIDPETGVATRFAGIKLADKVAGGFNTASEWTIITENKDGKLTATYASGWYYVPALTNIEGLGKLKSGYILNYDDRLAVRFDPSIHSIISSGGNLAVTENLIFNADPTNMDGSAESWGAAKLYGFSSGTGAESVSSGWTPTSLNFDGVDDYLEIYVDSTFQSEGITIETYGYFDTSNYSKLSFYKGPAKGSASAFKHTLANGTPCNKTGKRFQISGTYYQGIATGSDFQCTRYPNDFHIEIEQEPKYGDVFVTFVLSKMGEFKVYVDGKLAITDSFNAAYAEKFQTYLKNKNFPIQLGKTYTAATPVYAKQKLYSMRVYDSLLSADEVLANYNATTSYHNLMVQNGGGASNNNTGGTSFDTEFKN